MPSDFDPGTGLGPRLRLVREEQRLSVRELARRIGCSASLISQIERGVSVPSVGVLYSLAAELDSSLDYLLFGSDQGQRAELRRPAADPAAAARDRYQGRSQPTWRETASRTPKRDTHPHRWPVVIALTTPLDQRRGSVSRRQLPGPDMM